MAALQMEDAQRDVDLANALSLDGLRSVSIWLVRNRFYLPAIPSVSDL